MQILQWFMLILKRLQTIADEQYETNKKQLKQECPFTIGDVIKNPKTNSPHWLITRIDTGSAYGHSTDPYQIPCWIEAKYWPDHVIVSRRPDVTNIEQSMNIGKPTAIDNHSRIHQDH